MSAGVRMVWNDSGKSWIATGMSRASGDGCVVVEDHLVVLDADGCDEHTLRAEFLRFERLFDRTCLAERQNPHPRRESTSGLVDDGRYDPPALGAGYSVGLAHEPQNADTMDAHLEFEVDEAS